MSSGLSGAVNNKCHCLGFTSEQVSMSLCGQTLSLKALQMILGAAEAGSQASGEAALAGQLAAG